jgi:hypothetical protein
MKWLDKENISALLGEQNSILDYLRWDEHLGEYLNSNNVSMGRGLAGAKQKCVAEQEDEFGDGRKDVDA